jgi:hypothetical protein
VREQIKPGLEFARGLVSSQRDAALRILPNAPQKIPFDERARLGHLQARLDPAPPLASQLVKQGIGLDSGGLLNPAANSLSWNRSIGFQRVEN